MGDARTVVAGVGFAARTSLRALLGEKGGARGRGGIEKASLSRAVKRT